MLISFAEQKETQIREQTRKIADLEDTCQDYEGTISQFRELVMQLQLYVLFRTLFKGNS